MLSAWGRVGGMALRSASRASPRRFMATEETARDTNKLLLNFLVPSSSILKSVEVDMVVVPAATGAMGILPNHVPTVAQMNPGIVSVHDGDSVDKYFVSSGYTFVHPDRTDVCAAEAVKLEDVDADVVKNGLAECQEAMNKATDEAAKAEAQIGFELYTALQGALESK